MFYLIFQDQDSWGKGSNGTTASTVSIRFLNDLPTRRSVHICQGGKCCEFFDETLLDGYVRTDPHDMSVTRAIFAEEQKQNEQDGATVVAKTEVYVFLI